jgi:hypothetical protein
MSTAPPPGTRPRVPLRQFVFTVPFELRARLAYGGKLLGAVGRLFIDSVLGFYRRTLRDVWRVGTGQSGAVTVVQRCSPDLRLNPHFHSIALDGVFVPAESGELEFHALPSLTNADAAELLQTIRLRVLAFLEKRGVIVSLTRPVRFFATVTSFGSFRSVAVYGPSPVTLQVAPFVRSMVPKMVTGPESFIELT